MFWQTARRRLSVEQPLVMAVLNVTPDSFSDGGQFRSVDEVLRRTDVVVSEGADIVDIGGESTRPGSYPVNAEEEIRRTAHIVRAITGRFDVPVSIDTSKSDVARHAIDAGAEIINDISGLRFDRSIATITATSGAGIVLMHSRGPIEAMHTQSPVGDIVAEVIQGFYTSIETARSERITDSQIVLDVGIGFGKTQHQNLELLAKLDKIVSEFPLFPMLTGTSRKSFLAEVLDGAPAGRRLNGSLASASIAVYCGARIVRAHDVKATVEAIKVAAAIFAEKRW